jgi:hypothetical protein
VPTKDEFRQMIREAMAELAGPPVATTSATEVPPLFTGTTYTPAESVALQVAAVPPAPPLAMPRLPTTPRKSFQRHGEKPPKGAPCWECSCQGGVIGGTCAITNCECHTGVPRAERIAVPVVVVAPTEPVPYERCRKCMTPICTQGKCSCICHGAWRLAQPKV